MRLGKPVSRASRRATCVTSTSPPVSKRLCTSEARQLDSPISSKEDGKTAGALYLPVIQPERPVGLSGSNEENKCVGSEMDRQAPTATLQTVCRNKKNESAAAACNLFMHFTVVRIWNYGEPGDTTTQIIPRPGSAVELSIVSNAHADDDEAVCCTFNGDLVGFVQASSLARTRSLLCYGRPAIEVVRSTVLHWRPQHTMSAHVYNMRVAIRMLGNKTHWPSLTAPTLPGLLLRCARLAFFLHFFAF
jgi:hypothetical protein